ncbi:hypothetical protein DSL92_05450 [Billgrantia gudaonensis]|uniref:Uncharacterized protein n=1 Tax=Billgrantia gudaonensis TaxID=376427 RepID=A0A432JJT5_9GAMM|nr:hypothetical protein DSL92_05450 [Halomonas gudaonensis]
MAADQFRLYAIHDLDEALTFAAHGPAVGRSRWRRPLPGRSLNGRVMELSAFHAAVKHRIRVESDDGGEHPPPGRTTIMMAERPGNGQGTSHPPERRSGERPTASDLARVLALLDASWQPWWLWRRPWTWLRRQAGWWHST